MKINKLTNNTLMVMIILKNQMIINNDYSKTCKINNNKFKNNLK